MTALVNGVELTSARVTVPWRGPMLVELAATGEVTPVGGVVTVVLNSWTIACTLVPQRFGMFAGRWQGLAVGGRGGWKSPVSAKGYRSPAGLTDVQIYADAAASVGELPPVVTTPRSVGGFYIRQGGEPASQVFSLLAPGQDWWVSAQGVTQVGARTVPVPVVTPITVLNFDRNSGRLSVATEDPQDFQPGVTFVDPMLGPITIDSAVWTVADGSLRGELWTA